MILVSRLTFFNYIASSGLYNDLLVEEFSLRIPEASFIHIFPGLLRTRNKDNAPFFAWMVMSFLYLFISDATGFAKKYVVPALKDDKFKKGWFLLGPTLAPVAPTEDQTEENRRLLYEHSLKIGGYDK